MRAARTDGPRTGGARSGTARADTVRAVLRTTRLGPFAVSATAGTLLAAVPVLLGADLQLLDVVMLLRCAVALTVLGIAFVLDDRARATLEVLPVSAARVAAWRAVTAGLLLTAVWTVQLLLAPLATSGPPLPWAGLTLEPLTLAVWTLVLAAYGARRGGGTGSGGVLAAPGLLLLTAALALLPDSATLFAKPRTETFTPSRWWWAALLATGVAALAATLRGRARR